MDSSTEEAKGAAAAVRKREPIPGVSCTEDPDATATFYCAACQKSFCEDCVGSEEGARTYCLQCAVAREEPDAARERFLAKTGKFQALFKRAMLGLSVVIIGVNAYIILSSQPVSDAQPATPPLSPQLSGIVECRHRLEAIAAQALAYQKSMGTPPDELAGMEPLFDDAGLLYDPVSHVEYILESGQGEGITVYCPTPEAHGLVELYARPGKPARMVYLQSGESGK